MTRRLLTLLLALGLLGAASSASAQAGSTSRFPGFQSQEFDDATGLDINYWQLGYHPECTAGLAVGAMPSYCMSSAQDEDASRQSVSTQDRALRAGVLMLGQVWAMVETMKNMVSTGRDMYSQYEAIIRGFDKKKPSMTVIRIANATDAITDDITAMGHPDFSVSLPMDDPRYATINDLAVRALGVARDGEVANQSYNDALTGVSYRLGKDGGITLVALDGSKGGGPTDELPPLPVDAPPQAFTDYGNEMEGFMGAGRLGPSSAAHASFAPEFAGSGPSGAPAGAQTGQTLQCAVPEDKDNMDPSVMYSRVATMIHGARTAIQTPMADVAVTREELRVTSEREKANVIESTWRSLIKMFRSI
jgi:hypothetical protein